MSETNIRNKINLLPWLIPLVALIATIWLIYKNINEAGVEIVVNFKNASSLKEKKTFVKYKGFNVGKVVRLEIAEDVKSVNAYIKLNHKVADLLARQGSDFWIVEPRVSTSEISGLDTIISGSYIEVRLQTEDKKKLKKLPKMFSFQGTSHKPLKYYKEEGINITLEGNPNLNIQRGTPVFYKKIETGKVIGTKLINNEVKVYINIYDRYKDLINSSTVFYKTSGLKLQAGFDGVDLEVESLASLISGGISFETLDEKAKKLSKQSLFKLYENYEQIGLNKKEITFTILNAKDLKANKTPIMYKGLEVGKISTIKDKSEFLEVKASIDKKYEKYLSDKTKFYIVNSDLKNLEFDNMQTIVKGTFISFIPKKGIFKDSFKLYENYKKMKFEDMVKVKLRANRFSNLNVGSEVYYKNVVIGRIVAQDFEKDLSTLLIDIVLEKKYKKLLNDKTMFYIISTPLIESKNLDFKVNFERVKPFVFGGIGIEYLPSNSKKVEKRYWLYDSFMKLKKDQQKYLAGHRVKVKIDKNLLINEDVNITFNGIKIGFVEDINRLENSSYATFFIENKYKDYIKDYSKFYYQNGLELSAGLEGVKLKMNSLNSLLKGSVALSNKHKIKDKSLKKFKYKLYKDYESIPFKRFNITLKANQSYDLKKASKIFYKGIEVGQISSSTLSDDLKTVVIKAFLYDKYKSLSFGKPYYYVIKPDISLDGVKGLKTLLKGTSVNLIPSKRVKSVTNSFTLNENEPKSSLYKKGVVFTLSSKQSIDLTSQTKVYYKKIEIGEVDKLYLSLDATKSKVDILVYEKYKSLVRKNSIFYESSGIDVDVSLLGADIKADTLNTILYGGIILYTPNNKEALANEGFEFTLQKNKEDKWETYNPSIKLK